MAPQYRGPRGQNCMADSTGRKGSGKWASHPVCVCARKPAAVLSRGPPAHPAYHGHSRGCCRHRDGQGLSSACPPEAISIHKDINVYVENVAEKLQGTPRTNKRVEQDLGIKSNDKTNSISVHEQRTFRILNFQKQLHLQSYFQMKCLCINIYQKVCRFYMLRL